jgi:hypothetical protein
MSASGNVCPPLSEPLFRNDVLSFRWVHPALHPDPLHSISENLGVGWAS